jgi:hypothetical protein
MLAVSWLFPGKEVRIDATCLDCLEPMSLRIRDGEILEAVPATLVGHQNAVPAPGVEWGDL